MAVWQPHKLSTKLCRLFDAGYCDVRTFAREVGEPWQLIEKVTNKPSFRISRELELRIGRVLGEYMRKHPELYHDPGPVLPESKRGVVEESSHRRDERRFSLFGTTGKWFGTFIFPADQVDEMTISWLWRVLNKKDPERQIKIV